MPHKAAPSDAQLRLVANAIVSNLDRAAGKALVPPPAHCALAIFQHGFPSASGDADQIVVEATSGTVTSTPARSEIEAMLAKVGRLPHVASVTSPYAPGNTSQVSRDQKIAFATVTFDTQAQDLPSSAVNAVIHTARAARGPDLKVELAGQAIEKVQPSKSSNSTVLGIFFALLVLGLAFGALCAAITPIVTALVVIGIGFGTGGHARSSTGPRCDPRSA